MLTAQARGASRTARTSSRLICRDKTWNTIQLTDTNTNEQSDGREGTMEVVLCTLPLYTTQGGVMRQGKLLITCFAIKDATTGPPTRCSGRPRAARFEFAPGASQAYLYTGIVSRVPRCAYSVPGTGVGLSASSPRQPAPGWSVEIRRGTPYN